MPACATTVATAAALPATADVARLTCHTRALPKFVHAPQQLLFIITCRHLPATAAFWVSATVDYLPTFLGVLITTCVFPPASCFGLGHLPPGLPVLPVSACQCACLSTISLHTVSSELSLRFQFNYHSALPAFAHIVLCLPVYILVGKFTCCPRFKFTFCHLPTVSPHHYTYPPGHFYHCNSYPFSPGTSPYITTPLFPSPYPTCCPISYYPMITTFMRHYLPYIWLDSGET